MPQVSHAEELMETLKQKRNMELELTSSLPERTAFREVQRALTEADDPKEIKRLVSAVKSARLEYVSVFHEWIARLYPHLLFERGEDKVFWLYEERDGIYVEHPFAVIRGLVLRLMIEEGLKDSANEHVARDILARYRAVYPERAATFDEFDSDDEWFHAENGWLHLADLTFEEHTPARRSRRKSAVPYVAGATCPLYDRFIDMDMRLKKDEVRVLDQFSGLILTHDMRHQQMLTLIGRPGSGKSTLVELWFYVLGDMAVQKRLGDITGDRARFIGGDLIGRTLCWFDEVEVRKAEFDNALGTQITGEYINVERKGINGTVKAKNYLKNVLTANSLPHASTHGIYRRLLYFELEHSFTSDGTVDRTMPEKLRREASGVLLRMLRGLADLRRMGGFTTIEGHEERIEDYKASSDTIAEFLDTYFDPLPGMTDVEATYNAIPTSDMFNAFKHAMGDPRWIQLTPRRFGRMLGAQPLERFSCMQPYRGAQGSRKWKCVALKDGYEWEELSTGERVIKDVSASRGVF